MDPIGKYLARYAEPQMREHVVHSRFKSALVVPAYDEPVSAITDLLQTIEENDALLIAVVNIPANAPPDKSANSATLLKRLSNLSSSNLLLIDQVTKPLPRRQGVGLARKIGCDIALNLHNLGAITSPWIYTSDADVLLPGNYFSHTLSSSGAHVFTHRHESADVALQSAVDLYDQHMAYYVAGLTYAGSRYAYPTLGSTIAVHAETYAQVRGFPKRNAAEDFYLLNKVAKVSSVRFTPEVEILIQARLSERVPFGTGPALTRILSEQSPFLSYDLRAFQALKTTLAALDGFAETGVMEIDRTLLEIINSLGWQDRAARFVRAYKPAQRRRAVHDWFDGLKTLRFMHLAADQFPHQPLLETIKSLPESIVATINRHLPRDLVHK